MKYADFCGPIGSARCDEQYVRCGILNAIEQIVTTFKGIHTGCGLSNISFGLPNRPFLNQTFMSMAIAKGLDGAIINPLDKKMMANIIATTALSGKDDYCIISERIS